MLDFQKIKQVEREKAQRLAKSAAGAAMEADARLEARNASSMSIPTESSVTLGSEAKTFEPGEGKSAEESFATQFTAEEKNKIRDLVANATSAEDIDRIESMVKRGVFPGHSDNGSLVTSPAQPSEVVGKRAADGESGGDSKKQRQE